VTSRIDEEGRQGKPFTTEKHWQLWGANLLRMPQDPKGCERRAGRFPNPDHFRSRLINKILQVLHYFFFGAEVYLLCDDLDGELRFR